MTTAAKKRIAMLLYASSALSATIGPNAPSVGQLFIDSFNLSEPPRKTCHLTIAVIATGV